MKAGTNNQLARSTTEVKILVPGHHDMVALLGQRDELLAIEQFDTLLEAQVLIADWRIEYNTYRPHSALSMLTPAEFADQCRRTNPPKLS